MPSVAGSSVFAGVLIIAAFAGSPAWAECAGLATVDVCLVGAWRQSGGGAGEWMKRNMPPGMPVPQIDTGNQMVVLNRDGTYWTMPATGKTAIRFQGSHGELRAEGTMNVQAKGRWSAQSGALNLCPDMESVEGQVQITSPGGRQRTMPVTPRPAGGTMSLGYRCSETGLETKMVVPGINDPMVTQYARAKP